MTQFWWPKSKCWRTPFENHCFWSFRTMSWQDYVLSIISETLEKNCFYKKYNLCLFLDLMSSLHSFFLNKNPIFSSCQSAILICIRYFIIILSFVHFFPLSFILYLSCWFTSTHTHTHTHTQRHRQKETHTYALKYMDRQTHRHSKT